MYCPPKKYKMATVCSLTVACLLIDVLDEMIGILSIRAISDLQIVFLDAIS